MEIQANKKISIAVLPLKNISSNEENDHFCDGMTEEIISALSKIDQLKVISRTSSFYFKNHTSSLGEIAEKLDVSVILEGSVRVSGHTIRIQVQLIDVEEDTPFWIESWDRNMENLFEIQDEISLLIADKIREQEGHLTISDHLFESPTKNLKAYECVLKGRFHANKWNSQDAHIAIEQFEKAMKLDANLIDAYLGLANSYSFLAVAGFAPREASWRKATDLLQTAKALDPNHPGLNYILGNEAWFTKGDFAEAMHYYQKSLAAKPTFAETHQFISYLKTLQGDFKKAKEHIQFAKSIDPLNPETRYFEANYFYRREEYAPAKVILDALLEKNERNLPALVLRISILIKEHKLAEALNTLENAPAEIFTPDERLGLIALIDVLRGNQESIHLKELEEHGREPRAHFAHSYLFIIYANLGKYDSAFAIMEHLFESRSSILLLGFSDPLAKAIKADPRYPKYYDRVYPKASKRTQLKKSKPKAEDESRAREQVKKLKAYMNLESPFLNPKLSLRSLAEQVDIHPNQLSWLLNKYLGKNFNEFINHKRIEHFKILVRDPANAHISIAGLAYESGFNSKTVFNTTFKKVTGMTPKQYQKGQA